MSKDEKHVEIEQSNSENDSFSSEDFLETIKSPGKIGKKKSIASSLKRTNTHVEKEDNIKKLKDWLYKYVAENLATAKLNEDKVVYIKMACLIDFIGKIQ